MATLLNQILQFIGNHICVESGTSGIWTYKKFGDGTAECWTSYSASLAKSYTYNNMYGYEMGIKSYPITFIERPTVTVSGRVGTGYTVGGYPVYDTAGVNAILFSSVGSGTVSCIFNIDVKGKWK